MILELYKQLLPEEAPIDINMANKIWDKIEDNGIKYFIAIENGIIISSCYLAIIPNLTKNGMSNCVFLSLSASSKNHFCFMFLIILHFFYFCVSF